MLEAYKVAALLHGSGQSWQLPLADYMAEAEQRNGIVLSFPDPARKSLDQVLEGIAEANKAQTGAGLRSKLSASRLRYLLAHLSPREMLVALQVLESVSFPGRVAGQSLKDWLLEDRARPPSDVADATGEYASLAEEVAAARLQFVQQCQRLVAIFGWQRRMELWRDLMNAEAQ